MCVCLPECHIRVVFTPGSALPMHTHTVNTECYMSYYVYVPHILTLLYFMPRSHWLTCQWPPLAVPAVRSRVGGYRQACYMRLAVLESQPPPIPPRRRRRLSRLPFDMVELITYCVLILMCPHSRLSCTYIALSGLVKYSNSNVFTVNCSKVFPRQE